MTIPYIHVGCDISSAKIDFVDGSGGQHWTIENSGKKLSAFLEKFRGKNVCFAFEATGHYGLE